MTSPVEVRTRLLETFRRDLIGPSPADEDLARERLKETPSRWYLTGFLAPVEDPEETAAEDNDPSLQEEADANLEGLEETDAETKPGDDEEPEVPNTRRRFLPSSIGLTVLIDPEVAEIEAEVSWGDYRTEPPLPENVLAPYPEPGADGDKPKLERPRVDWIRAP